jgi:hypothetical protein
MTKLFINNLQIGNYPTMVDLINSIATISCLGSNTKSIKWVDGDLYISTFE